MTGNARQAPAAPWPIIRLMDVVLARDEHERIDRLVSRLLANDAKLRDQALFSERVLAGWSPGPTLYLEDHRAIEFQRESSARSFEYRSLALAGDGDFLLLSRPRSPLFETYLSRTLGLGNPTVLTIPYRWDSGFSLAGACRNHPPGMAILAAAAKSAGGLNIIPYISSGNVWLLAAAIAQAAQVPIRVGGAPPLISRLANDKGWFSRCVHDLLGPQALPTGFTVFGPAAAAGRLRHLAHHNRQVVLKTPSSAGSQGNLLFDSSDILSRSFSDLRSHLLGTLRAAGWHEQYPVLIGVWEHPVLCSPSAQLWVPLPQDGPPVLEGIFVQSVQGANSAYIGAEPAVLPPHIAERFARESTMLATLLQKLGYFGRASFDALLLGKDPADAVLHWIECNGRWGGTSIPMTVAHRLGVRLDNASIVIVQKHLASDRNTDLDAVLHACSDQTYSMGRRQPGVVSLLPLAQGETTLALLAIAATTAEARHLARDISSRLGSS